MFQSFDCLQLALSLSVNKFGIIQEFVLMRRVQIHINTVKVGLTHSMNVTNIWRLGDAQIKNIVIYCNF